jgi:Flavodoxin domain
MRSAVAAVTMGRMNALVVYESMYGNTRAIAEAIAEGLGGATVQSTREVADGSADLLIVGGPTHMHGLTTSASRRMAAEAVKEDGHGELEPGATDAPGLRQWLRELPKAHGARAATFDTRVDRSAALTGSAARGIARRVRRRGYNIVASESYFVQDGEGPLEDGELERARAWGAELATSSAKATAGA